MLVAVTGDLKRAGTLLDARLLLESVVSRQDVASGGAASLKSVAETFGRYAAGIEAKAAALSEAAHKLAEKMYAAEQAQAGAGEGAAHGEAKKDEGDVVDAEFTEVKTDKK